MRSERETMAGSGQSTKVNKKQNILVASALRIKRIATESERISFSRR